MIRGARPTLRGILLFLVGALFAGGASAIGEPDLVWIGIFLCVLPILSLIVVAVMQPSLAHERILQPAQVAAGERTEAIIRLNNRNPAAATTLEMHDESPSPLGGGARFVVARAFGRWSQSVRYAITTTQRGRFLVGPLKARAGDPLGLAVAVFKSKGDPTLLRVTPKIWPITKISKGMGAGATGEASPQRTGAAGQDDVIVREHRHGDDIRRVHWRMSAKQGELMVRVDEHPWDPSALIITDTRRTSHAGKGADSSLEWVISAATSVAVKMSDDRYRIVVAGGSGTIFEQRHLRGPAQRQAVIDAMTDLGESDETELKAIFGDSESLDATGSLVVFGGCLTINDAATLTSLGRRMSKPCAVLPDAAAWGLPVEAHGDAVRLLQRSGWAVELYRPKDSVTRVWSTVVKRQAAA